jgi:hypothetical protein
MVSFVFRTVEPISIAIVSRYHEMRIVVISFDATMGLLGDSQHVRESRL